MPLVLITGLAITSETERRMMQNLLAMPLRLIEALAGKITPYIFVCYIQLSIILGVARYLFDISIQGNLFLMLLTFLFYIAANLAVGITFQKWRKSTPSDADVLLHLSAAYHARTLFVSLPRHAALWQVVGKSYTSPTFC